MTKNNLGEYLARMNAAYSTILARNMDVYEITEQNYLGRGIFDDHVEDTWHFLLPTKKRRVDTNRGVILSRQDEEFLKRYEHCNLLHKFPINSERSTAVRVPDKIELEVLEALCKDWFSFSRRNL